MSIPIAEGVLYAKKDFNLPKHPEIDVPNLQVIKVMQSFTSKKFVKTAYSWQYYYYFLTNEGIEYLRDYLNYSSEAMPQTLKKATKPATRPPTSGGPPRGDRGDRGDRGGDRPPRFGGDRDSYRSGGGFGRGGDKGGAPEGYNPSFGGGGGGFGRGRGFAPSS